MTPNLAVALAADRRQGQMWWVARNGAGKVSRSHDTKQT